MVESLFTVLLRTYRVTGCLSRKFIYPASGIGWKASGKPLILMDARACGYRLLANIFVAS